MTNIFIETLEDKLGYFRSMAFDNPAMLGFLDEQSLLDIPHIDKKCVIFSLEGEEESTFKYVVHPKKYTCIDPFHQGVNLRGLKNQMFVQDVSGVQKLASKEFYEGIIGLMGRFDYLPGFNLKVAPKTFSRDADKVFALFKEIDASVKGLHTRKIMHNDIKPGNIVYSQERLHLIDFSTSVNFTEYLLDKSKGRIFGTQYYIHPGVDRSKDYFALGVSFVKTLFPNLDLDRLDVQNMARFRLYEFELDMRKELMRKLGYSFTDYFNDLMHRTPEIDYGPVAERLASVPQDPQVRVNYTYGVGNTTFIPDSCNSSASFSL